MEQKREFYRLPVTRCRPHPAAHGSVRQPSHHCPSDQPSYPPNESGNVVVAGRVGGGKGDAGPGIMVEEHRFRARDHIEFREVTIGTDEGLVVDISYKGRKGPFPDIDGLVISVPVVRFPKYEDDSPLVCNWKALFDGWLKEVRLSHTRSVCPNSRRAAEESALAAHHRSQHQHYYRTCALELMQLLSASPWLCPRYAGPSSRKRLPIFGQK